MLGLQDQIMVDITTWDYVPELKVYGPRKSALVRVDNLINALNRGVEVSIPQHHLESLFMIVKEHNLAADEAAKQKKVLPRADKAEDVLTRLLYKDLEKDLIKERASNPLIDDSDEREFSDMDAEMELAALTSRRNIRRKKSPLVKRKKVYTLFQDPTIPTGGVGASSAFQHVPLDLEDLKEEFIPEAE